MKRFFVLALFGMLVLFSFPLAASDEPVPALAEMWIVDGTENGGQFAYAVAVAGDLNGDGFADVVVGAPRVDYGVYRAGAAFVYRGGPGGLPPDPHWGAAGHETGDRFGQAVSGAGDVNGDGFDDLLIGAYRYNNGMTEAGAVYLYHGSPFGLAGEPTWTATGAGERSQFGYAVAAAGDVNGDGYGDVLVGARRHEVSEISVGAVYLYYGSPSGLAADPGWYILGTQASEALGTAVAGAGDVDGDGFDDFIIGAPYYDGAQADEGRVLLFYGSASGPVEGTWSVSGEQEEAELGRAVASAGDVNGDGYDDVLVGAPRAGTGIAEVGLAFLFLGSPDGLHPAPSWVATTGQVLAQFGASLAGAGDVNHDGYDDVLIGAPLYDGDQPNEGGVFLYLGTGAGLQAGPAWRTEGNKADTLYGLSVALAGDINGDQYDDLLVGAPEYRVNTILVGRALAYVGADVSLAVQLFLPVLSKSDA